MKLDDMMRDAVAPVQVDVHDLTSAARARGTVRRRQRRLAVVLAGVGAAATVVGLGALVAPTPDGDRVAPAAPTVASDPTSPAAADVRLDGRTTVAVLRDLLGQAGAEGTTDAYGGQGAPGGPPDTYGDLHLTPPGEGLGEVGVNVQGREMLGDVSRRCEDFMADCTVRTLVGGDVLRVYSDADGGPGERRVAELLSERRGIRVVVSATDGLDLSGDRWDVTRDGPVLDDEELTAVATAGVWGFEVPGEYAAEGAELSPYTDYDAAWSDEPTAAPTVSDRGSQPSAEPSE